MNCWNQFDKPNRNKRVAWRCVVWFTESGACLKQYSCPTVGLWSIGTHTRIPDGFGFWVRAWRKVRIWCARVCARACGFPSHISVMGLWKMLHRQIIDWSGTIRCKCCKWHRGSFAFPTDDSICFLCPLAMDVYVWISTDLVHCFMRLITPRKEPLAWPRSNPGWTLLTLTSTAAATRTAGDIDSVARQRQRYPTRLRRRLAD